ncbi:MarR family transcriptional regulator [Mesorhizobium sp. DCY119]|jgi:DNA-binding MarR family transcriptional regulator|uniref:MarR family winged helix-turn-helix transcriptional regulator n=1 Tax=Mesorhizobium sp. DCY119 TaxID=2108445 RepID=UPI000E6B838B|nr:MarR family transcriptional regulator [Mesorhizobium sp. DCY119]RJG44348.1 MarR family transcriptional regulator [Mesorhizobium sp. DCY119]
MDRQPDDTTIAAWIGLSRAQRVATASIEAQLKAAGFPPLAWYDALWELERAGGEGLRPFELERALLFEQYNLSRLIDRLEKAGLVARRACPDDKRGQVLAITPEGLTLRRDMWGVYGPAIEAAVGAKLDAGEAKVLAGLLTKLAITSA